MKFEFDMALFLSPVLKGAHATRQRHIRQTEKHARFVHRPAGYASQVVDVFAVSPHTTHLF